MAICDFSRLPTPPPNDIKADLGTKIYQLEITPPPPRKLKFMQILALCDFSVVDYPPPPMIEIQKDLPNGQLCVVKPHVETFSPTPNKHSFLS